MRGASGCLGPISLQTENKEPKFGPPKKLTEEGNWCGVEQMMVLKSSPVPSPKGVSCDPLPV